MPEIPGWVAGPISGGLLYVVLRYFGPALKGSLNGQAVQWRSENRYIKQLEEALDKERQLREAAENREDELFKKLSSMEAKMEIMGFKLESAESKIMELTTLLDRVMAKAGP